MKPFHLKVCSESPKVISLTIDASFFLPQHNFAVTKILIYLICDPEESARKIQYTEKRENASLLFAPYIPLKRLRSPAVEK